MVKKIDVRYFSKGFFPSGNFINVQFTKRQLPIYVPAAALGPQSVRATALGPLAAALGPLVAALGPQCKVAAWEIVTWKVALGKMPLGKYLTLDG